MIVMTPKSLLRHKRCVSSKAAFMNGSTVHRVLLEDRSMDMSVRKDAKRVVLCTGKVYYDLLEEREQRGLDHVHLVRVEQLYPFPSIALAEEMESFKHCEFVWCQEEPANMGAWQFVRDLFAWDGASTRRPAASPATGSLQRHKAEQQAVVDSALGRS